MNNKNFGDNLKPFMTNKGFSTFSNIAINDENEVLITDQNKLAETVNNHYINIVENSTGKNPSILGDPSNQENDKKNSARNNRRISETSKYFENQKQNKHFC